MDNCNKFISKYTPNTSAAGCAAKAAKDSSIKVNFGHIKYDGKQDRGKARKFQYIESDMLQTVQCRWDEGNPITKTEIKVGTLCSS
eukprot:5000026-Ditylum_brightwellii.AAC.1